MHPGRPSPLPDAIAALLLATGLAACATGLAACATRPPTAPTAPTAPIDAATLADPDQKLARMEHLRRQLVRQTRHADEQRYRARLRPEAQRKLRAAGLTAAEAEQILTSVDASRRR